MLIKESATGNVSSRFHLKNVAVDLIQDRTRTMSAEISLQELESMRSARRVVPASKHGLEIICGGSCETGAQ
jgi:hypothetical protein